MKRLNNKGVTLIEILVGMAIGSIVLLAAFTIFNYTSSSYSSTSKKITAQEEAEYASNFIYELLVESTDVRVTHATVGSGLGSARCKVLVVTSNEYKVDDSTGKNTAYRKYNFVVFNEDTNKLYFTSGLSNEEYSTAIVENYTNSINDDTKLLAEHVSAFDAEAGNVLEGESVNYSLSVSDGSSNFSVSNDVYSRNTEVKEATEEPTEEPTTEP